MSKIVAAVNAMITNQQKITSVIKGVQGNEIFFLYDNKHKWSIRYDDDGSYNLYYYPSQDSLESLSKIGSWDPNIPMMYYTTSDIGTDEAKQSFRELYGLIKEKIYGVDEILDEIIKNTWV